MHRVLVYIREDGFKDWETGESFRGGAGPFLVVVPRKDVMVDRVTLPKVALEEGGREALLYQARRIFERDDLEISYLVAEESEDSCTVLLFAVESSLMRSILQDAASLGLHIDGITLASLASAKEDSSVWIRWDDGYEVAIWRDGTPENVFFVYYDEEDRLGLLKRECAGSIELIPFSGSALEVDSPFVIFEPPRKRGRKTLLLWLVVILLLAFSGFMGYRLSLKLSFLRSLEERAEVLRERWKKGEKINKEIKSLQEQIEAYSSLFKGIRPLEILSKLSSAVPKGTIFMRVTLEKDKVELEGVTPSVSSLLESLGNKPWISDMKLLYSQRGRRFGNIKGEFFRVRLKVSDAG